MRKKTLGLVKFARGISAVYAFSACLMALGSPMSRVLLTVGMAVCWLILAEKTHRETLTVKSMVKLFLALAAIYLLTSVDYFMDGFYFFAGCHALAFLASLAVAIAINWKVRTR